MSDASEPEDDNVENEQEDKKHKSGGQAGQFSMPGGQGWRGGPYGGASGAFPAPWQQGRGGQWPQAPCGYPPQSQFRGMDAFSQDPRQAPYDGGSGQRDKNKHGKTSSGGQSKRGQGRGRGYGGGGGYDSGGQQYPDYYEEDWGMMGQQSWDPYGEGYDDEDEEYLEDQRYDMMGRRHQRRRGSDADLDGDLGDPAVETLFSLLSMVKAPKQGDSSVRYLAVIDTVLCPSVNRSKGSPVQLTATALPITTGAPGGRTRRRKSLTKEEEGEEDDKRRARRKGKKSEGGESPDDEGDDKRRGRRGERRTKKKKKRSVQVVKMVGDQEVPLEGEELDRFKKKLAKKGKLKELDLDHTQEIKDAKPISDTTEGETETAETEEEIHQKPILKKKRRQRKAKEI